MEGEKMITHAEILKRAHAVPLRSDPYSQQVIDGDGPNAGYRPDCSGWVSYCWGVPKTGAGTWGGYSTATFITTDWAPGVKGIMVEIPRADLKPGDAIGYCTPTSGGNGGHIALWLGKSGSAEHILDMPGGWGPIDHTTVWGSGGPGDWNSAARLRAFRYRGVSDVAPAATEGDLIMFCRKGDVGQKVEALQLLLRAAGADLGPSGVDGSYGPATAAAVVKLGLCATGGDKLGNTYGPTEYAALHVLLGKLGGTPGPAGPAGPKGDPGIKPGSKIIMTVSDIESV